jgi:DNA polymerase
MTRSLPENVSRRAVREAERVARDGAWEDNPPVSLEAMAAGVGLCRRCDLWRGATQGVPGAGPAGAALMLVGEQPGDQEDLAGAPFVGPAGRILDQALAEAGAPRNKVFVTNAVKHFKYEPRGKRRLHKTPDAGEVSACRWWLDAERRLVRPKIVVAMGATAALGVFGRSTPIGANRGRAIPLAGGAQGLVTYHPSYVLRSPEEADKARALAAIVEDLRRAWALAGPIGRSA